MAFIGNLKGSGDEFKDDEFPTEPSSLIYDWNDPSEDILAIKDTWSKIEWLRASQIPCLNDDGQDCQIFEGAIEPNDIKQGSLGDCYFLSSLSVICEHPNRIRSLFEIN